MKRNLYILGLILFLWNSFLRAEDSFVSDGLPYSELIEQNEFQENVRIGSSFFELGKYVQACHFLEKAYSYKPTDEHVSELLYWSYVYMGRDIEAKRIYRSLSPERTEGKEVMPKPLVSAYVEGGVLMFGQDDVQIPDGSLYAEEFEQNRGAYVMALLTHDVMDNLQIRHGFNYFDVSGEQRVDSVMVPIFAGPTDCVQYGYLVNLRAALPKQWRVTLSGYVFGSKMNCTAVSLDTAVANNPMPDYNDGRHDGWHNGMMSYGGFYYMGWWSPFTNNWWGWGEFPSEKVSYKFSPVRNKDFGYVTELAVQKSYRAVEAKAAVSYSHIGTSLWQTSAQVSYYPFDDGRLYLRTLLAGVFATGGGRAVFEEKVGGRIYGELWGECAFAAGNMSGFNENELANVYVMQDRSKYRVSANLFFAVTEQLSVNLMYKFMEREGRVYYVESSGFWNEKTKRIFSNNLIGGVRWNF